MSDADRTTPERTVYAVEEFNGRLRSYLQRVRAVWVEGEVSGLRRNDAWATVFLTLKGQSGASLAGADAAPSVRRDRARAPRRGARPGVR